jgi:selenocysteine lyase/cysteine desulfurase
MIYLNQAGTSWPKPSAVLEALTTASGTAPDGWDDEIARHHGVVCAAFGIRHPARLLITPGCTSALAIGISDHDWRAGDRILVSHLEHHALDRPARLLAARGVERAVIPRDGPEAFALEALESQLARGHVRLVAVTAICNVTGERLPIDEIIALAHAHGALCLVDAAQWAGWESLDVEALGVDLLAFAGHKGPHGPRGAGGLYVAPHVELTSPAALCSLDPQTDPPPESAPMPGYCDVGSVDRVVLAGLAAGLRWLEDEAAPDRLQRAQQLSARLADGLADLRGWKLHGGAAPARMPTIALTHERHSADALARLLRKHDIVASAGMQCAPLAHEGLGTAGDGVLRLSLGPASQVDDVDRTLEVLANPG